MKQTQLGLYLLQENNILEELKKEVMKHQRILLEVQEVYNQFQFFLNVMVCKKKELSFNVNILQFC